MDMDMSGLSGFDRSVKEALEPYEVPYNSADWSHMERALDGRSDDVARVSRSGLYALLLGGSLAAASSLTVLIAPPEPPAVGDRLVEHSVTTPLASQPEAEPTAAPLPSPDPVVHASGTAPALSTSAVRTIAQRPANVPATTAANTAAKPSGSEPTAPGEHAPMLKPSITEGCPGSVVVFETANLAEDGKYLWNFGDGNFSNQAKPSHVFSKPGSFEVMLSHSGSKGGSIRSEGVADRIIIHEAPEASFTILKQEYDNTVPSVHFENRSLGGRTYIWDFGDGGTSSVAHPDHVYKKAGTYTVSLTVVNGKGCEDREERTLRIDSDYDLMATKTFSPNSDGVDDFFMPEALKTLGVRFHLSIFESKTGKMVFETTDAQRPWNGRLNNKTELCATGDYIWMVEMKDGEKLGGTYNGSIQLVR